VIVAASGKKKSPRRLHKLAIGSDINPPAVAVHPQHSLAEPNKKKPKKDTMQHLNYGHELESQDYAVIHPTQQQQQQMLLTERQIEVLQQRQQDNHYSQTANVYFTELLHDTKTSAAPHPAASSAADVTNNSAESHPRTINNVTNFSTSDIPGNKETTKDGAIRSLVVATVRKMVMCMDSTEMSAAFSEISTAELFQAQQHLISVLENCSKLLHQRMVNERS
jgi:hypothetical protein